MIYSEDRPWGNFGVIHEEEGMKVKKITVSPGKRLSLQSHKHRAENWVIVQGDARVTLNGKLIDLKAGESVFIEKEAKHRIENYGTEEDVIFVEVQTGDYLGEDDIIRYEDDFNRI